MNKRFPLTIYVLAAGFASALGLYQLIPVETITTKIALVILFAGIISAGLCALLLKQFIKTDRNYRWGLLMAGTFAVATALVFLFHLSLPQKELLLQNQKITVTLNVSWNPANTEQQPIEFLSLNNGYRGYAFNHFQFSDNWEKRKDAVTLENPETQAMISFAGKTGKQVSMFFRPGSALTDLTVDWGDGSSEKIALQKNKDEFNPHMITHDYGETAYSLEVLNFIFNLLPVIFMIWILLSIYLLILILILRKRDRTFRTLFILISLATIVIRFTNSYHFPLGFDEGTYARAAMRYGEKIKSFHIEEIPQVDYNLEHPALIKLAFALPIAFDGREYFDRFGLNSINNAELEREDYTIFTARLINAVFAFATVQALTVLIHPITGSLFMIHSLAAEYGAQARLEAFPMLFSFLAIWFFLRFLNAYELDPKTKKRDLWVAAIFLGLTAASKIIYCLVVFAIAATVIELVVSKRISLPGLIIPLIQFGFFSVLIFFLFNPILWVQPLERLKNMVLYHQRYQANARDVHPWWQPIVWITRSVVHQTEGYAPKNPIAKDPKQFFFSADELIFLLGCYGFSRFFKKYRTYAYLFFIAIGFLLVWGTKWEQYACVVTIPICIAATIGIQKLASRIIQYDSK
ncbi:MAG: hypothetical protein GX933_01730 [Chloroflexi bacterium]|nr:hypothetical protein [Chloroflexota bacterium]